MVGLPPFPRPIAIVHCVGLAYGRNRRDEHVEAPQHLRHAGCPADDSTIAPSSPAATRGAGAEESLPQRRGSSSSFWNCAARWSFGGCVPAT